MRRQPRHRFRVALQHRRRFLARLAPEGEARILAGAGQAAIGQGEQGVHRAAVPAQHPPRLAGRGVPQDHRLVEAAGGHQPAGHCQRPHRPAMAAELLRRGGRGEEAEGEQRADHSPHLRAAGGFGKHRAPRVGHRLPRHG